MCKIDRFEIVESLIINDQTGLVEGYSSNSMRSKIYLDRYSNLFMDISDEYDWKVKYIKASLSAFPMFKISKHAYYPIVLQVVKCQ